MVSDRSNGIYRSIFAALAGLILIGANEPRDQATQSKQGKTTQPEPKSQQSVAFDSTEATKPIHTPKETEPCGQSRYASNDDLCAQWKAADSAAEAAKWAWWQIILSGLGVIGLGFTLWFNFRALRLAEKAESETKDALDIAGRNADAAARLVKITAEANRPWIKIDCAPLTAERIGDFYEVSCKVEFTNIGKTVARHFNYEAKGTFVGPSDVSAISDVNSTFAAIKSKRADDIIVLMPRENASHTLTVGCLFSSLSSITSQRALIVAAAHYQIEADGEWKASEVSFIIDVAGGHAPGDIFVVPFTTNVRRFVTGLTT